MHFACTQENLLQGLQIVSHLSGKNANLPVLGNVLMKTEAGSLRLSTTNLEIAASCLVRGKVEVEGEYSVPAKLFLDYIALLSAGKVDLELKEEGLEIRAGDQETMLRGLPATEFPVLPKLAKEQGFLLNATEFRRAMSQVAFAVAVTEQRPELMGVACFFGGIAGQGRVAFAATDAYRLAERLMPYGGSSAEGRYVVPAKAFGEASRIIGAYKDEMGAPEFVELRFTDNQLVVSYGNVDIVSRLIETPFPDYRPLIPQQFKSEAVLVRADLQKAVKAASLFSRQGIFDVHLSFEPEPMAVTVQSADQGTGKTKTAIKSQHTGESNRLTLNYRFLSDGLAAMDSTLVRIRQIDPMSPAVMIPEGSDEAYLYLLMPIRNS